MSKNNKKHNIIPAPEVIVSAYWPIGLIIILIAVYLSTGLEGSYVLFGLTCRNTAWLILSVILLRRAIAFRKERAKEHTDEKKVTGKSVGQWICLGFGIFFAGAFLQANVILDMLVFPRRAVLKECVIQESFLPSFMTGYDSTLTGINENGYTKSLPLTPPLTERAFDELDRKKQVRVIFYEHVRRVIILEKTQDGPLYDFWE